MSDNDFSEVPTSELWIMFQEHSGTFRLEVAFEIARRLHNENNWIELIAICESALESTDIETDYQLRGHFEFQIGFANYSLGRYNESVTAYVSALPNYRQSGDYTSANFAIRNACDGLLQLQDYDEVLRLVDQGIEVCDLEKDQRTAADLLMRRGFAYKELDEQSSALTAFEAARQSYQSFGYSDGMIRADFERVDLLLSLDRPADAVAVAEGLLVMAHNSNDATASIRAAIKLADSFNQAERYIQCETLAIETEKTFIEYADSLQQAQMKYEWAFALSQQHRFDESNKLFRETRALAEYGNSVRFQTLALDMLYVNEIGRDKSAMRWALIEMINHSSRYEIEFHYFQARCRMIELELEELNYDAAKIQIEVLETFDASRLPASLQAEFYKLKATYSYRTNQLQAAQAAVESGLKLSDNSFDEMFRAEIATLNALILLDMGLLSPSDALAGQTLALAIAESVYDLAEELALKMRLSEPLPTQPKLWEDSQG